MKRRDVCLIALALAFGAIAPIASQEKPSRIIKPGEPNPTGGWYEFGHNPDLDNPWGVVGNNWRKALADPRNSLFQDYARNFVTDGKPIVVDHNYEKFFVPPGMVAKVPLVADEPASPASPSQSPNPPAPFKPVPSNFDYRWLWLLIIPFIALIAYWLYKRNPTQWRPMVQGGLANEEAARRQFDAMLANRYPGRPFTDIGQIDRVTLVGPWRTSHRGIPISVPHNLDYVRAYRRHVRFADNGRDAVLYSLQECGNDAAAGTRYLPGPGAQVLDGWVSAPAAVPSQPAQTATPVPAHSKESVEEKTTDKPARDGWIVQYKPQDGNRGVLVRVLGIEVTDFEMEKKHLETTFRFTEVEPASNAVA